MPDFRHSFAWLIFYFSLNSTCLVGAASIAYEDYISENVLSVDQYQEEKFKWIYETYGDFILICQVEDSGKTTYSYYHPITHEVLEIQDPVQTSLSDSTFWDTVYLYTQYFLEKIQSTVTFSYGIEELSRDVDYFIYQFFGDAFLQFHGYHKDGISHIGTYNPDHELNDNVRITFINGMLNGQKHLDASLEIISKAHGDSTIHYVFRATDGWTNDLLNSACVKFISYTSEQAYMLADLWKELIADLGGPENGCTIIHYAHSIGATDSWIAKSLLSKEEQQCIHVITIGSPTMIPHDAGFASVVNYVSKRDGVSIIFDTIGCLNGWLYDDNNIYLLESDSILPWDHYITAPGYSEIIRLLGENFVKIYGSPKRV